MHQRSHFEYFFKIKVTFSDQSTLVLSLVFDLWGSEDGMLTSVSLDNVNVSVVPAPGGLVLGLIGMGAVGILRRSRIEKVV